jgi:hypothetical protein
MLQHLVSPGKPICALALAVLPWTLGQFRSGRVELRVLRRQVAFEIGFSRESPMVVTGASAAIKVRRPEFWLGGGSESRGAGTIGLLGGVFTAVPEIM